ASIWVVAEAWQGRLTDITFEALALGREVADSLKVPLEAILPGHDCAALADQLGCADGVLYADHPALAEPVPEPLAQALAGLARQRQPRAILIPATNTTWGASALLAAMLDVPSVNFGVDLKAVNGSLEARCVLYGGKIEARVRLLREPAVVALGPGSRPADQGRSERKPPVEQVSVSLPVEPRVRLLRYIEPEAGEVDLTREDILVAVGRGIQSKDNLELAEELAQALGGEICGSRPVVDQGWLPLSRQIGKSGLSVKPKLYLALGISGAPEHVEGMKNSGLIVAVNTDPHAPIFNVAHYGVVADVLELMPALAEAVRARKG
ncbi:MAG: electron transfer flavoprotein subunit alpha/FixB family protein, partial [Bryobacteraceae bacterium]